MALFGLRKNAKIIFVASLLPVSLSTECVLGLEEYV